jgi:uncharacterized delta-60 repeat protein
MKLLIFLFGLLINTYVKAEITGADSRAIAIGFDGSVVIAGTAIQDKQTVISAARYLSNGVIDASFGANGIASTIIGDQAESNGILLQSTGKIVVAGFALIEGITNAVLVRYDAEGTIDTSFGSELSGIVVEQRISNAQIADIKQQSDGKIIVCGTYSNDGRLSSFVIRYTSEGLIDDTFGNKGIMTKTVGYHTGALGCDIQSDDKIIVCGFSIIDSRQVIVFRLNDDGSEDFSYGTKGFAATAVGKSAQAESVIIDSKNKVIVTGSADNMFLVLRYNSDGTLDQTFGKQGIIATSVGNFNGGFGVTIDESGNVLCCGYADQAMAILRFDTLGNLDINFNSIGYVTRLIDNIGNCGKAIVTYNKQIYVAGAAGNDLTIQRYIADGRDDSNWYFSGIVDIFSAAANSTSVIFDEKNRGLNGGTFTAGSWITRTLNQIVTSSTNVSIENNHFTLQPGVYEISVAAPAYMCGNHKIRLQNISLNQTVKVGTAAFSSSVNGGAVSNSLIETCVIVKSATDFEIQHRCSATRENDGFGIASDFDETEVYTVVKVVQK